jgi:hypothetical protein
MAMSLTDQLVPRLRDRFPGRGLKVTGSAQPCAVFPAIHPDVGDLEIHDDGDELTVIAGNFTHGHFSNYKDGVPESEKYEAIITELLAFLDDVFADQMVLWGSHDTSGGWFRRKRGAEVTGQSVWPAPNKDGPQMRSEYVWSGPLSAAKRTPSAMQRLANWLRRRG